MYPAYNWEFPAFWLLHPAPPPSSIPSPAPPPTPAPALSCSCSHSDTPWPLLDTCYPLDPLDPGSAVEAFVANQWVH